MKSTLPGDLTRIVRAYWADIGTPVASALTGMLDAGDWDGVSQFSVSPVAYSRALDYLRDATSVALLRKYEPLPTTHSRKQTAIGKWMDGERECYRTNERLSRFVDLGCGFNIHSPADARIWKFIHIVRKRIERWIGSAPPNDLNGRFGKGGTYLLPGNRSTIPEKIANRPSRTRTSWPYLFPWVSTQWGKYSAETYGEPLVVRGNSYLTVPKDSRTDRSIGKEPDLNMFYQLALGNVLRQRLKNVTGWDLNKAQDIHRRVACEASVTREFATLDLSNASDTVAISLVQLLLPPKWFDALSDLRSPFTEFSADDAKTLLGRDPESGKKHWVRLEKFSSMGNGFTFELETILFLALASTASSIAVKQGVVGKDVYVFGDDIIVREDSVNAVKSVLRYFGFTLNDAKSFSGHGNPFRESCGADYFNGVNVRPFYLKKEPCEPEHFIALANGLRRNLERLKAAGDCPSSRSWFRVLDCIPSGVRSCRGPENLGDLVIHDDFERWSVRARNGGQRRYVKVWRPWRHQVVSYELFPLDVILACATYGCTSGLPNGARWSRKAGIRPRDSVTSYKVGWASLLG